MWVMNKRDKQRLEAAEMKFLRPLLEFTKLDQMNTDIRERLKVQNIVEDILFNVREIKRNACRRNTKIVTKVSYIL
jgi:hypothetical protein